MEIQKFRFRAECLHDFKALLEVVASKNVVCLHCEKFTGHPELPDVICELHVQDLTLEELKNACRGVQDGQVMLQTLAASDHYTGERNYDLQ